MSIQAKFNSVLTASIKSREKLALAVSGGMDSMCMLLLCIDYCKISDNKLAVISIDHGIRGESSKSDLAFVEKFCKDSAIEFLPYAIDIPLLAKKQKLSIETSARNARKDIFNDLISRGVCDRILLAHHASDNVESILMHLFRGSGLNGIVGMGAIITDNYIVRPLIKVSRKEIEQYVYENKTPFVTDETNSDTKYTRNFIRQEIISKLKQAYPQLEKSILQLSNEVQKTLNAIKLDESKIIIGDNKVKIELSALKSEFPDRYILSALEKINKKINFSRANIEDIIALKNKRNGASISLPNSLIATREYTHIVILKKQNCSGNNLSSPPNKNDGIVEIPFHRSVFVEGPHLIKLSEKTIKIEQISLLLPDIINKNASGNINYNRKLYFDFDKIPTTAIFRHRKNSDVFKPFGGKTKSLSDYLTDKKIPRLQRESLIYLCSDNQILAIIGIEISDHIKVCNNTKITYSISLNLQ